MKKFSSSSFFLRKVKEKKRLNRLRNVGKDLRHIIKVDSLVGDQLVLFVNKEFCLCTLILEERIMRGEQTGSFNDEKVVKLYEQA